MQENKSIIEVDQVSKFFGEKIALDNVTLNVKKGEFVTILGPSGCGKTTLLRLIAGFQTASEGQSPSRAKWSLWCYVRLDLKAWPDKTHTGQI